LALPISRTCVHVTTGISVAKVEHLPCAETAHLTDDRFASPRGSRRATASATNQSSPVTSTILFFTFIMSSCRVWPLLWRLGGQAVVAGPPVVACLFVATAR
jgi:hypothetical protein